MVRLVSTFLAFAAGAARQAAAMAPDPRRFNVEWAEPSPGPGRTQANRWTYKDAMPLGNGALTALAWANSSNGGVGIYLGHQNAQSSHTELFKLGLVQVALAPNPFKSGSYFNQTLDLATGAVVVHAGGTSPETTVAKLSVWVDQNDDTLYVDVDSPTGANFSLHVDAASVRPAGLWTYKVPFGACEPVQSQPDVFVNPLPDPVSLRPRGPPSEAEAVRHASGRLRPTRTLGARLPAVGEFQPGSLIVYHRNSASDGLTVNLTLTQQGLPQLIATTPDWWSDLQFGFALDSGAGPALVRSGPAALESASPASAFQLRATVLAVQTDSAEDWLTELAARVSAAPTAKDAWAASTAWWADFWARSYITVNTNGTGSGYGPRLTQMLALTRYTHAVQSRGTIWPIKFNGMAFVAAMDEHGNGEPDYRHWGPSNWWQNTRFPYGAMLLAGDYEQYRVVLEYFMNMEKMLGPRTLKYWGHKGMWTTETHHLTGAYAMSDYGCGRPESAPGYPVSTETSAWIHLDQGGDSGTGEYPLMALDYYAWTGDPQYLLLAFQAANYFMNHYQVNATTGRVVVSPTQVLEMWWCVWDDAAHSWSSGCPADDTPTISAMMVLFEKLLQLPEALTTSEQRAAWATFASELMPALPVSDKGLILPARILGNSGGHNDEGPELYPVHPHRIFTKGREVASGVNISVAVATHLASRFAKENSGWNYGLNSAALLGLTDVAARQLLERALSPSADGYRFDAFAPHYQDFDPSADHFASMLRAAQEMLLQSGDDGLDTTTIVLFPAWPCGWDVRFKLWGPLNTTVEVDYVSGVLKLLIVSPPERAAAIKWANCVSRELDIII